MCCSFLGLDASVDNTNMINGNVGNTDIHKLLDIVQSSIYIYISGQGSYMQVGSL